MSTQLNITYVCPTHDTWVAAVPLSSEEQRQLQAPGLSEVHQVEAALVDPSMLVVHLEALYEGTALRLYRVPLREQRHCLRGRQGGRIRLAPVRPSRRELRRLWASGSSRVTSTGSTDIVHPLVSTPEVPTSMCLSPKVNVLLASPFRS